MMEMTRVWERFYIGGHDDAQRLFNCNPKGITTVISLFEISVVRRNPEINYMHIPIADAAPIKVGQFDAIIDAVAENVRWGTVLLHCGSGMSRAPIMAAAWRALTPVAVRVIDERPPPCGTLPCTTISFAPDKDSARASDC